MIEVTRDAAAVFDNAAVRLDIVNQQSQYEIRWAPFDNTTRTTGAIRATLDTFEPRVAIPPDAWGPTDAFGFRYARRLAPAARD